MNSLIDSLTNTSTNTSSTDNDSSTLLEKQQQTQQQLNQLLEYSQNQLNCGPECQKWRTANDLRQKYIDAEANATNAPVQLEDAKRNFYEFTRGIPFYEKQQKAEMSRKIKKQSDDIESEFNKSIEQANTMSNYYQTALTYASHLRELSSTYKDNLNQVEDKIKNLNGDILTNSRKAYYESIKTTNNKSDYNITQIIYYALIIFFSIYLFLTDSLTISNIIIIILFLCYSFIITWLYYGLTYLYNKLF